MNQKQSPIYHIIQRHISSRTTPTYQKNLYRQLAAHYESNTFDQHYRIVMGELVRERVRQKNRGQQTWAAARGHSRIS